MEYFLICLLFLLGVGFHVGEKIVEIDKLSPDDSLSDVFKLFWKQDKVTIFISGLILVLIETAYFITESYVPNALTEWWHFVILFVAALVLGYGGQRLVYGALGKSVVFAEKKINEKLS